MIRLDKFLAHSTGLTRTEVRQMLRCGRVSVDGTIIKSADLKIDEIHADVALDGRSLKAEDGPVWYMMNKCAGVVTADTDRTERTVMDLMDENDRRGVHPVGRLDKDTEGLLLLTDDGQCAHNLLSPRRHVEKAYQALVSGQPNADTVQQFAEGLEIGEKRLTLPAVLKILESGSFSVPTAVLSAVDAQKATYTEITIHEGKFHQIKRMFHAVGCEVLFLRRLSMGPIVLDQELRQGAYRRMTKEEIDLLYASASDRS